MMLPSIGVYLGLTAGLIGLITLILPLRVPGLRTRLHGVRLGFAGLFFALACALLPAQETKVPVPRTQLDHFTPRYQFSEHHRRRVDAAPADVYRAINQVTAGEIRFFEILIWIRRCGRGGPASIMNAPPNEPLLALATRTTFVWLADESGRELVVGTIVIAPDSVRLMPTPLEFATLARPGYAKAAMNFLIEPDGAGGTIVSTETRVYATDAGARRRFAAYWRVIYPGSALIRRGWLRAVEQRAEAAGV